uniref:Uncharacterized protein n=1 Tax=Arundo donax TaxID=35708 RepID=A0A0A9GMG4_ARUDO
MGSDWRARYNQRQRVSSLRNNLWNKLSSFPHRTMEDKMPSLCEHIF